MLGKNNAADADPLCPSQHFLLSEAFTNILLTLID